LVGLLGKLPAIDELNGPRERTNSGQQSIFRGLERVVTLVVRFEDVGFNAKGSLQLHCGYKLIGWVAVSGISSVEGRVRQSRSRVCSEAWLPEEKQLSYGST